MNMYKIALLVFLICATALQLFAQTVNPPLAITHVTIIDATGARAKRDMTVVLIDGQIASIGKTGKIRLPDGLRTINATGKFLVPAFWDMHVHFFDAERTLPLFVANGVLGVRELGGPIDDVLKWRANAVANKIISPRIVTAGRILDGDPPSSRPEYAEVVKNANEGRDAVRRMKSRGVDLIKVYDALSRESYFAIVDEAKNVGIPFGGHTPTVITTLEASDAGQRTIEHLGKILEDSSGYPAKIDAAQAEKIPANDFFAFTTRLGRVYNVTLETYSPKKAAEIFRHFRKNKSWQVPTLVTKYGRTFIDDLDAKGDPRSKYLPASDVAYWKPKVGFFSRYRTPTYIEAQKRYFARELKLVGDMQRAGVGILAGTDCTAAYVIPGFSLHDELALYVEAGLTPMQALQTATRNAAEYLGELAREGTIEKGKRANLILLDRDPLVSIRNTTSINTVIQNGRYLSRGDLDKILADVESLAARKK